VNDLVIAVVVAVVLSALAVVALARRKNLGVCPVDGCEGKVVRTSFGRACSASTLHRWYEPPPGVEP
jgi:hypothetical protein